jgi:hypothetical protein
MKFNKNMGMLDRNIRVAIAILIAVLYFSGNLSGLTATILCILAVVFVVTSFIGFCPLYTVIGLSTCKK